MRASFSARLQIIHKPIENIAHRRLAGLQPEESRQHAAVHDAAEAGHIRERLFAGTNRDVARAGANDFHQGAGRHAAADSAEVRVKRAHGNWNTGSQTSAFCPGLGKSSHGFLDIFDARCQAIPQFAEAGI